MLSSHTRCEVALSLIMLGKKRLEVAIAEVEKKHEGVKFDVRWHPYQLNPNAPAEGELTPFT